ncbi:MAG: DUF2203 domain-containing protein [Candidatus Rokuibacteriota bacterium]
MADRYFTPDQVVALIPALNRAMGPVMAAHEEAVAAREELAVEQRRVQMAGGAVVDQAAWRATAGRIERLTARMQAGLEEIVKLGGVPKDLSLGLVDFPHRRGGKVVNLCWKYGEADIRWWHGLDEGYTGRQPL